MFEIFWPFVAIATTMTVGGVGVQLYRKKRNLCFIHAINQFVYLGLAMNAVILGSVAYVSAFKYAAVQVDQYDVTMASVVIIIVGLAIFGLSILVGSWNLRWRTVFFLRMVARSLTQEPIFREIPCKSIRRLHEYTVSTMCFGFITVIIGTVALNASVSGW